MYFQSCFRLLLFSPSASAAQGPVIVSQVLAFVTKKLTRFSCKYVPPWPGIVGMKKIPISTALQIFLDDFLRSSRPIVVITSEAILVAVQLGNEN
jgi:hypothetical protein